MQILSVLAIILAGTATIGASAKKCAPQYVPPTGVPVATSDALVVATATTITTADATSVVAAATTAEVPVSATQSPDVVPTTDATAPAPAPQTENDAPASATVEAPAPAPQSVVDLPASTSAASVTPSGDLADSNIPSPTSNLPAPAINGCNGDNLEICKIIAASDFQTAAEAAVTVSSEFNQACLDLNNHARYFYGNPNPYLVWNQGLANWAVVSSAYAETIGCYNCHTYSGSGMNLPWGQNLFLGYSTCADAYFGWITQEAEGNGNEGEITHFLNAAGWSVDPTGGTGFTQIGCGTYGGAIVCNIGLDLESVTSSLENMPTDFHTALALALQGISYPS
ncbi:hypothetical protein HK100_009993 [Physocladia obscura]|uniref:Uncharacterized protein n=1 Tax=Physocladia obscura TaxID=109957 RepID=A0AAD5T4K1_9FUNG|nr:hypothetical protein HK100_009993 [Physocladia obscura]